VISEETAIDKVSAKCSFSPLDLVSVVTETSFVVAILVPTIFESILRVLSVFSGSPVLGDILSFEVLDGGTNELVLLLESRLSPTCFCFSSCFF